MTSVVADVRQAHGSAGLLALACSRFVGGPAVRETFAKHALDEALRLLHDEADDFSTHETDTAKILTELVAWAREQHAARSPKCDAKETRWWAHQLVDGGGEGAYFGDVVKRLDDAVCDGFGMMLYLPSSELGGGVTPLAGGRYKGMWTSNQRHGAGTMRHDDGSFEIGGWKDGAFVSDGPRVGATYRLDVGNATYVGRPCECLSYAPDADRWCVKLLDGDEERIRVRRVAMRST
jgi:hypothetical protein